MEAGVRRSARLSRSPAQNLRNSDRKRRRSSPKQLVKKVSTPKTEGIKYTKKRRRSSIKRRSLIATLECIQSNEVSSLGIDENDSNAKIDLCVTETNDKTKSGANGPVQNHAIGQVNEMIPVAKSTSNQMDSVSDIIKPVAIVSSANNLSTLPENVLDISSSNMTLSDADKKSKALCKLKTEYDQWVFQKKKYREQQISANARLQSTVLDSGYTLSTDSKYEYYHEQINDLEDKFAKSINIISNAMSTIEKLKDIHTSRVRNISKEVFKNAFKERGEDDPKHLMETIFLLHNMPGE